MRELDLYQLQKVLINGGFDYEQLGHIFCSAVTTIDPRDLSSNWRKNRLANAAHTRFQDYVRRRFAYAKNMLLGGNQTPDEILDEFDYSIEKLIGFKKPGTIEACLATLLKDYEEEIALTQIGRCAYMGAQIHHQSSNNPSRRPGQEYLRLFEQLSEKT